MLIFSSERSGIGAADVKDWLVRIFGGGGTRSGQMVSAHRGLTISAVFRAVDNLSGHIAMLPFPAIGRSRDDKGREVRNRLFDDPLDDLLNLRANSEARAFDFKRTLIAHRMWWGNGFGEIVRREPGEPPLALYNLLPWRMHAKRDPADLRLYYEYHEEDNNVTEFNVNDVVHIAGLGDNGVMGHIVHYLGRENMGLILAIQTFAQSFFGNGGMPRIVFEYAGKFGRDEEKRKKFLSSFDKAYSSNNANKSAVLENGMTAKVLSAPNDDSQMLESQMFGVEDVCRWLNVPPHLLYKLTDATYNNIDQMNRGYAQYSMGPIIKEIEEELNFKLIPARERKSKFVEINVAGLLRGDTKTRYEAHKSAIEAGWKSRNEVRQLENMNPEEGLDAFMEPLNHAPAGSRASDAPANPGKANDLATGFATSIDQVLNGWKDVITKARARKGNHFDDHDFAAKVTSQAWPVLDAFRCAAGAVGVIIPPEAIAATAKQIGPLYVAAIVADAETSGIILGELITLLQTGDNDESNASRAA